MNVDMTAQHWFHQGGFVMYILVVLSIVVIAITLEKFSYLRKMGLHIDKLREAVKTDNPDMFQSLKSDPLCELYRRLHEIKKIGKPVADSLRLLDRAVRRLENRTSLGIGWLATIGNTAPFVGLFGTVIGIIRAFRALSDADPAAYGNVSAGIAEALVATASGLVVAVPSVMLFNYLLRRINSLLVNVKLDAEDFLEELLSD